MTDKQTSYLNSYRCPCGEAWDDEWDSMCNDRCPECNAEIEPFNSVPLVPDVTVVPGRDHIIVHTNISKLTIRTY